MTGSTAAVRPPAPDDRPPGVRGTRRRPASAALVLALAAGLAACGGDDGEVDEADRVDEGGVLGADLEEPPGGPDASGLLGLEVTAEGDVAEWVATNAFRLDKDGVGASPAVQEEVEDLEAALDDEPTSEAPATGDDDVDDEEAVDRQATLVIVPRADLDLRVGDPVRVTGAISSLDPDAIDEVYGVEVDADSDVDATAVPQLFILAESVEVLD